MIQHAQQFSVEMKEKDEGPYRRMPQSTTQPIAVKIPRILCMKIILLTMVSNSPVKYHIQRRWLLRETKIIISTTTTGYMAYMLINMDNSVPRSSFIIESRSLSSINSLGEKYTRPRMRLNDKKRNNEKMQILMIQVKTPLDILMIDLMMQMIVIKNPKIRMSKKDEAQYFTISRYSNIFLPVYIWIRCVKGGCLSSQFNHVLDVSVL